MSKGARKNSVNFSSGVFLCKSESEMDMITIDEIMRRGAWDFSKPSEIPFVAATTTVDSRCGSLGRDSAMGLAFTKIWQRLIGKQEMRILMVGHLTFEMLRSIFGRMIFGGKEVVVDHVSVLIHLIFLICSALRHAFFCSHL